MSDKMREEFERVVGEAWEDAPIHLKSLWEESWKASRAVIRVDLPHLFPFYREGVTEALLAHGIKINQWGSE